MSAAAVVFFLLQFGSFRRYISFSWGCLGSEGQLVMTIVHFPLEKGIVVSLHVSVTQSLLYSRPGGHETSDEVVTACPVPDP